MIRVEHLRKEYIIPSQKGRKGIKSFLGSSKEIVCGLQDVSFQIKEGEFVGLVGLNGAGKTTLIKVLSGILTPTKGSVEVLGYCPYKNRKKYTTNIGVVMGQRTVLFYDLPVIESYKFFADVYGVDKKKLQEKLDILDECMGLKQFLHIRCASFLWDRECVVK